MDRNDKMKMYAHQLLGAMYLTVTVYMYMRRWMDGYASSHDFTRFTRSGRWGVGVAELS